MYSGSTFGLLVAAAYASLTCASPRVLNLDFVRVKGEAHSSALRKRAGNGIATFDLTNAATIYLANISVGTPPQPLSVQIDTGSADLWLPETKGDLCTIEHTSCPQTGSFDISKSSTAKTINTTYPFRISYADQSGYNGSYFTDVIHFGSQSISNYQMALVDKASGVVDKPGAPRTPGILGVGFESNEAGVSRFNATPYPNFVHELKRQGVIDTMAYSLWLNKIDAKTGSILFGGVDTEKFKAPLVDLPIVPDTGSSKTDGMVVELTSIALNDKHGSLNLVKDTVYPALLDSGAENLDVPDFILNPFLKATGAILDTALSGSSAVACNLTTADAKFEFGFGGKNGPKIEVTAGDLIEPYQGHETFEDGSPVCTLKIKPSNDGSLTLGSPFLSSAYAVYNLEKKTIGLAQAVTNPSGSEIEQIKNGVVPSISTALPSLSVAAVSTADLLYPIEMSDPSGTALLENPGKPSVTAEHSYVPSGSTSVMPSSGASGTIVPGIGHGPLVVLGLSAAFAVLGGLLVL